MLRYFTQLVLAVRCLHSHRILHRDLKTHNIFLAENGASPCAAVRSPPRLGRRCFWKGGRSSDTKLCA